MSQIRALGRLMIVLLLLPRGRSPGDYKFRDLYNPMGQDAIDYNAEWPQVDEDSSCDWPSCVSHSSFRTHLGASQTTQIPVIFGIYLTKRRVSLNEKFTQGPGKRHKGWAAALEAALCYPHTRAAIRNGDCHLPAHH